MQNASDDDVFASSNKLILRNKNIYEELAK